MKPWQLLQRKTLVDERWLEVTEDRVALATGHVIERFHRIRTPDWVGVLCLTAHDTVVLVRQYRHGMGGDSLELPAGVIEPGEAPEDAARRELREETGFVSDDVSALQVVQTEPSRQTTRAHFYVARGAVRRHALSLDASEDVEVVEVPRREVVPMVLRGEIQHGIHVGAILRAHVSGVL